MRRVQVEGRVGLHSLCQGGCGFRGLSSKPWDLIPMGPGHGAAPGAGHVECATLGTEAFAFQNWLVNLCIVFRVWEFYFIWIKVMFCFGIGRRLWLLKQEMKNIGLESARLPLARLLGSCLGGQVEGFLPLPLPALVFLGQAGADWIQAVNTMQGESIRKKTSLFLRWTLPPWPPSGSTSPHSTPSSRSLLKGLSHYHCHWASLGLGGRWLKTFASSFWDNSELPKSQFWARLK